MNKKLELIDFLKGFSIFTIVVGHFLHQLPLPTMASNIVQIGGTGCTRLFWCQDLAYIFLISENNWGSLSFIKKRFTKIYLPYIFIVIVTALLSFLIPVSNNSWYAFFGHVFLYKMFDDRIMSSYGYQFWFISTIIQLYLIFTILAWLKSKVSSPLFFVIGLAASISWMIVVLFFGKEDNAVWIRFFLQYVWEFMLGMILASAYMQRGNFWKIKQPTLVNSFNNRISSIWFISIKNG